jgi:large subunit ribosomal protein L17
LRIVRSGFRKGDGGETAFVEMLGVEKIMEEKREKRAEARAKRRETIDKAMSEQDEQGPPSDPAEK